MKVTNERDLDLWRNDWRGYQLLLTFVGLGVFEALADGARTVGELGMRTGCDVRALDIGARVMAARGLLTWREGTVALTASGRGLLAEIGTLKWEWDHRADVAALEEAVRSGTPCKATTGGVVAGDDEGNRRFHAGLHHRAVTGAEESLAVVRDALIGVESPRILDLGGGHGRYAATFAAGIPGAGVTLFDHAEVLPIARDLSGDGFALLAGDFHTGDLGGPWDLAFLSNIVHGEGTEGLERIFARLRTSCTRLVIKDIFLDASGDGPDQAAIFGMLMLMYTEHGRSWSVKELGEMLARAGYPHATTTGSASGAYGFLTAW